MSNIISANALFHFTPKIEYLISILENGFYPRYCIEDIGAFTPKKMGLKLVAQPMVCFCDITLSMISPHLDKYGRYGIGMNKSWGSNKAICPVMYIDNNSTSSNLINHIHWNTFVASLKEMQSNCTEITAGFLALRIFFKALNGKLYSNGKFSDTTYNFYEEREWRYVPVYELSRLGNSNPIFRAFLEEEEFNNETFRNKHNDLLSKNCSLNFAPEDIKYLFVSDKNELNTLVDYLESKYTKDKGQTETWNLYRKIIITSELLEDT